MGGAAGDKYFGIVSTEMARKALKLNDIPLEMNISREEMRRAE